jgi:outer membrane protein assembly factor BamB
MTSSVIRAIGCALGVVVLLGFWCPPLPAQGSGEDLVISGQPLQYWTQQASMTNRSETVAKVVRALTDAVSQENPSAKVAAADALASLGRAAKPALAVLLNQLSHELGWVRASAAEAVVAMDEEAVPAVLALFEKQIGAPSVRAAFLLGALGASAKPAIPSIVAIMKDAPDVMKVRYADILNQIDPERFAGNTSSGALRAGRVKVDDDALDAQLSTLSADWPQFHGPRRDSICRERGLLQQWPEGGPKLLWTLEGLGKGYSSAAIVRGRIFTMGDRPGPGGEPVQFVMAFDLTRRSELWATQLGAAFNDGPRCTPTVVGDLVYALGTDGDLLCLDAATGTVRWRKNLAQDLGGKMMSGWKYSESPLVDGERLICTPGGPDAAMVALDRQTGKLLWKCALPALGEQGADGAGYSSAVVAEIQGVRQYVQMLGRGVIGVEASTGRFLWGYNRIACNVANVTAALVHGNYVFVTNAYNTGSALLEIRRTGERFSAKELYFLGARDFQNHHGGLVLVGGHIYGGRGGNAGHPTCVELATGKICWAERSPSRGSASVLYADGHVIFRYDRGEVILLEATPEAMRIKGRFKTPKGDGAAWAHPVIHQGRLYLRHGNILMCYDLRALD